MLCSTPGAATFSPAPPRRLPLAPQQRPAVAEGIEAGPEDRRYQADARTPSLSTLKPRSNGLEIATEVLSSNSNRQDARPSVKDRKDTSRIESTWHYAASALTKERLIMYFLDENIDKVSDFADFVES
jgi:hypothetical protein